MKYVHYGKVLLFALVLNIYADDTKGQVVHTNTNFNSTTFQNTTDEFGDLIWSDEFEVPGPIDTAKWFHQTKLPNGTSWWNNEIQHYTNRTVNSFIDSGYMHIVAKKEEFTDQGVTKQYTSARLNSKFAFTYGKVEIRAILPSGPGTWPAMWTLGKNVTENGGYWFTQGFGTTGWPACGEIDIMEHWGTNQDYVSSAMHTPSSSGNTVNKGGREVPNASTEFHTYRMEWTPEKIVFSIDSTNHYTYDPAIKDASTWPFDRDQYLLLNIAVQPAIEPDFSESPMIIDYVRIYGYVNPSSIAETGYKLPEFYPNPFENSLTVEVDQPQPFIVEILSLSGQVIYTCHLSSNMNQLDLSSLQKGVYLIAVKTRSLVTTRKIIKL